MGLFGPDKRAPTQNASRNRISQAPTIGGWEIEKKIGQGGFGTVYLGFKKLPGSQGKLRAAVKVMNSDLRDQDDFEGHVARFLAEFKILRELDNPNCARVLEADVKSGNPWMATQFVSGDSLHDEVRHEGPLEGVLWWFLARDVLLGLSDAHAKGIVHRDIKPQNIMRGSRGSVLIDFGIAKMAGNPKLTVKGAPMTPAFASPEQLEGRNLSPASDIFSLGHTLLFAATNRFGYQSESLQSIVSGILTSDPDLSGIPNDAAKLIRLMMNKNPMERPTAQVALKLCQQMVSNSKPDQRDQNAVSKSDAALAQRRVGNIRVFSPKAAGGRPVSLKEQASKIEAKITPSSKPLPAKTSEPARSWKDLEREILNFLVRAGKSQFVIPFESQGRSEIYFQGFFDDEGRVTIEAVSNQFLQKKLTDPQHSAMLELGWEPPTEGIPNYIKFLDFDESKKSRLSKLISDSLRLGYQETADTLTIDVS